MKLHSLLRSWSLALCVCGTLIPIMIPWHHASYHIVRLSDSWKLSVVQSGCAQYDCRKKSTGCDSNFSDNVEMESTEVGTSSADDGSGTKHSQKDRLLYVFGKISMKLAFERIKRATKEDSTFELVGALATLFDKLPSHQRPYYHVQAELWP